MVKWFMDFFTERHKVFCPTSACAEIGIFRVELEPQPMVKAVEHCIKHEVQLNEKAAVYTDMVNQSSAKRVIHLSIG